EKGSRIARAQAQRLVEVLDRPVVLAFLVRGHGTGGERPGTRAIEPKRNIIILDRAIGLSFVRISVAPPDERERVAGIKPDRFIEIADRAIVVALVGVGAPAVVIGDGQRAGAGALGFDQHAAGADLLVGGSLAAEALAGFLEFGERLLYHDGSQQQ